MATMNKALAYFRRSCCERTPYRNSERMEASVRVTLLPRLATIEIDLAYVDRRLGVPAPIAFDRLLLPLHKLRERLGSSRGHGRAATCPPSIATFTDAASAILGTLPLCPAYESKHIFTPWSWGLGVRHTDLQVRDGPNSGHAADTQMDAIGPFRNGGDVRT
jgi:hypothetical protein